ncbi:MAG: hypothetical protein JO131_06735, partial [Gammaproteobacteria bacterium]|nr:hypothetical protein [Gammaproteobacteria bacterium]
MDKQKTQRIIGILVIIAFVIVLIPLFFSRTDVSTEMSNAKSVSVPVPEQSTTTTTDLAKNDANEGQTPDDSAILGSETPATNQPEPSPLPINNTGSNFQNTANPDTLPAKNADGLQTQSQNIPRSADANASLQNTNANTTLQDNDTPH